MDIRKPHKSLSFRMTWLLIAALAGLSFYAKFDMPPGMENFACSYRDYAKIENGQSKNNIINILGNATKIIVRTNPDEYLFGQGEMDVKIMEAWFYDIPGWEGHIEIYFDTNGIVIGKNCGYA